MQQIRVRPPRKWTRSYDVDLRTPLGRRLPY
jgi:hypothetical protein